MGGKQEWIAGTTFPCLSGLWCHPPAIGGLCRGWGAFPESITANVRILSADFADYRRWGAEWGLSQRVRNRSSTGGLQTTINICPILNYAGYGSRAFFLLEIDAKIIGYPILLRKGYPAELLAVPKHF